MVLAFLAKIKLQYILILTIIAMAGTMAVIWDKMMFHKYESTRKGDNYTAMQNLNKEKTAHLEFRSTREIEDYVESEAELKALLDKTELKLKRANTIIYQKQKYIDNELRATDVTDMVASIKNNLYAKEEWRDSTECLVIDGNVEFKDSKLNVNVTGRDYDNSLAIVSTWDRVPNTWVAKVLGLGRKVPTVIASSKCGDSKTVIIERTKKK